MGCWADCLPASDFFLRRKAPAEDPVPPSPAAFCYGAPYWATAFYDRLSTVTTFREH
jgi:hypothetical protein